MTGILFVCLGNICRSPMAEFIMGRLLGEAGLSHAFTVASAATSGYEAGNPVYPPARQILRRHGIDCAGKYSRPMEAADYHRYDLLIGMDSDNLRQMRRICGGDPMGKLHRLLDYTDRPGDIADPWYTDDFDAAWRDILRGCEGLLLHLTRQAPR